MLRLLNVGGSYLVYGLLNIVALAFCWVYMVRLLATIPPSWEHCCLYVLS